VDETTQNSEFRELGVRADADFDYHLALLWEIVWGFSRYIPNGWLAALISPATASASPLGDKWWSHLRHPLPATSPKTREPPITMDPLVGESIFTNQASQLLRGSVPSRVEQLSAVRAPSVGWFRTNSRSPLLKRSPRSKRLSCTR